MIEYPKYKKVLFCTDFSQNSDCAFDYAFGIAKRDDGILYILHVIPETPNQYRLERHFTPSQLEKMQQTLKEERERMYEERYLSQIRDRDKVRVVTEAGKEEDKIIDFIKREGIDIVVLGTHGRTGIEHVFLGSVAEKVVRRSPVPVFVIPFRERSCRRQA